MHLGYQTVSNFLNYGHQSHTIADHQAQNEEHPGSGYSDMDPNGHTDTHTRLTTRYPTDDRASGDNYTVGHTTSI